MTETDTSSRTPLVSPRGDIQPLRSDALQLFDRHGAAVFASLCRVSVGDRELSTQILRETFAADTVATDRSSLLIRAHQRYLADPRSDDDWTQSDIADLRDEVPWATARWGPSLASLRGLATHERVAINLSELDGVPTDAVAELLGCGPTDIARLIASGHEASAAGAAPGPVQEVFRSAELWLGDDERDDIRVALGAVSTRPQPETEADPAPVLLTRRIAWSALVGVAMAAILAVVGVRWLRVLPNRTNDSQSVESVGVATTVPGPIANQFPVASASQPNGLTTRVDVTEVDGAIGEPDVFFMASGLDDPEVVVPEYIVRYTDGKVGLSWHSPCNRPAIAVTISSLADGAVVELTTGAFPIRSCIGMPDRWTAVVRPSLPLPEGTIRPLDDRGAIDDTWDGLVDADGPGGEATKLADDAFYGSALVDAANQPWVYGLGCSSRSARYLSPIGAIFEIRRAESLDPQSYSASDSIVCSDLASRQVLTGPLGVTFPNAPAAPKAEPTDCAGPAGSLIDGPSPRPFMDRFFDGDWSTWDGCLVRRDVVFSESLFETCAGHDVRTITFSKELGQPISDGSPVVQYIRDPDGAVAAEMDPFRAYSVPSSDVHDTGLRFGDQQLWVSGDTDVAIYVRTGRKIERWPRFDGVVSCATAPVASG
ncbi:MAG: hypothetical protein ABIR32_09705 [Ilumatobacteraceae bacterium]